MNEPCESFAEQRLQAAIAQVYYAPFYPRVFRGARAP